MRLTQQTRRLISSSRARRGVVDTIKSWLYFDPDDQTSFSASVRAKSSPAQQSQGYRYPAPGTGNGREAPSVPEYFNEDRAYRLNYFERDTSYNYREAPWVATVSGSGEVVEKQTLMGNTVGAIEGGGSEGGFRSLVTDNCDPSRIAMRVTHEIAAEQRVQHMPQQLSTYDWEEDSAAIVAEYESAGTGAVPGRETTFPEYQAQANHPSW